MKKILIIIFGFYLGAVVFMPKKDIYFKVLEFLDKKGINVASKTICTPFSLNLENVKIYYLKMASASIKKAEIFPFLFVNILNIKNLNINIGNYKIKNLNIVYIPFTDAKIKGEGNFGKIRGYIKFKEIKIRIENPTNEIKPFLKKDKKGYYYYERF